MHPYPGSEAATQSIQHWANYSVKTTYRILKNQHSLAGQWIDLTHKQVQATLQINSFEKQLQHNIWAAQLLTEAAQKQLGELTQLGHELHTDLVKHLEQTDTSVDR